MAGGKKAKMALSGGRETPRKHYCPRHGEPCQGVMEMPKRKMTYRCPQGCNLNRVETVIR